MLDAMTGLISNALLVVIALIVYGLKAFRFYMVLAGSGISVRDHLREFCKTVLVSIVLPLKMGELFRAYCYGHLAGDYPKGIVAVLLDRFSDTLALVTILFFFSLVQGSGPDTMLYLLLVFMIFLVLVYRVFPDFYSYWNRYLMEQPATTHRLRYLALLQYFHKLYGECAGLVHGRIFGLYVISLAAWSVEIGGVTLAARGSFISAGAAFVSAYLASAMGVGDMAAQRRFLLASCLVLVMGLAVLCLHGRGRR